MSTKPNTCSKNSLQADAAAKDAKKYEDYLARSTKVAPESCPGVQVFVEGENGQRQDVSQDSSYAEVKTLARTVLGHLVASEVARDVLISILHLISRDPKAKEALQARFGQGKVVADDVLQYLVQNTPAIVIKNLETDDGTIEWGRVQKGDSEGADANEVFILKELTDALRQAPPQHLAQAEFQLQRARQKFLWSIALLHEVCHALTKHFFTANTITPQVGYMASDQDGNGESGRTFELKYLGFILQCAWDLEHINETNRMWKIWNLLTSGVGSTKILSLADITRIQDSLSRDVLWYPDWQNSAKPGSDFNNYNYVRYRIGMGNDVIVDEDEEEGGAPDLVFATTCGRGLGIGIPAP